MSKLEPRSWRGVLDTVQCDKVCRLLATGRSFSQGTTVSFTTNKTDRHDIAQIFVECGVKHHKPNHLHNLMSNKSIALLFGF